MNKLQLYITTSRDDFKTQVEINAEDYVRSWICDLHDVVCQVDYPLDDKSIFYMVKYIDTGVFIIVLRTIPSDRGHHVAAWIYIPYPLRISNKELAGIVLMITRKIDGSEVTNKDIADMREAFAHEYDEEVVYPVFPPSSGYGYAYRYYGKRAGVALPDLIGQYLYQPCYLSYAGVLFIDGDVISDVGGANLTSAPLDNMAVLLPPSNPDCDGYHPTIYDLDFDMPYYVPMLRNFDIVWRKENAADIKQSIYLAQSEMRAPNLNSRQCATPIGTHDKQSDHDETTDIEMPDANDRHAADKGAEKKKVYHFQIPAKSAAIGTVIEFEITTNADLDDSPIEGYEPTSDIQEGASRSNHLLYTPSKHKKWITEALYALGGFILGVLVTLASTCSSSADEPQQTQHPATTAAAQQDGAAPAATQATTQPAQGSAAQQPGAANGAAADAQADRSLESAIKYLDSNPVWEKSEMEAYPDLQGLYDDLNNIDRNKIETVWANKLKDSRAFTNQVVHHSKISHKKKVKRNPFNTPEETKIRVQAYLNNIDP